MRAARQDHLASRFNMSPRSGLGAALVGLLLLSACGGSDDPQKVARDWRATGFACTEETERLAYELERHRPGEPSLASRLQRVKRSPCAKEPVPKIEASLVEQRGDMAIVHVSHSDEPGSYDEPETIVLVREEDEWKVDPEESDL